MLQELTVFGKASSPACGRLLLLLTDEIHGSCWKSFLSGSAATCALFASARKSACKLGALVTWDLRYESRL